MKSILTIIFLSITLLSIGQTKNELNLLDDHIDHHNHIGLATGPVYILNEKEFAPGLHLHIMRLFEAGNAHFGLGFGAEAIFDEHRHYATSLNISYLPIHELTLTIAPGIQFAPDSEDFTTHFEATYEFEIGNIHLGPVAEYAWAPNDAHAMLGLHVGFGF